MTKIKDELQHNQFRYKYMSNIIISSVILKVVLNNIKIYT